MEKKRIVVWGSFTDYERYRPIFRLEEWKGNIQIVAVMFLDEDIVTQVDGYPVIRVEELKQFPVDYIIGLGNGLENDMQHVLLLVNISQEHFIPGRVLLLPDFDFERYLKVRESHISIISDNCWGGFTYHALGMRFESPFINLFVELDDFAKLACHLQEYLKLPVEFMGTAINENLKLEYPIGRLGDIELYFNHYRSFAEADEIWQKRLGRLNKNNILVKMSIETEAQLEGFREIPYRKLGFSKIPCEDADVIDFSKMVDSEYMKERFKNEFFTLVNFQANSNSEELRYYDTLKLLLGEADYKRVN